MAVNTEIQDVSEYLTHIATITNMRCMTPESTLTGNCQFLAANLYARSIFGEDALLNLSVERQSSGFATTLHPPPRPLLAPFFTTQQCILQTKTVIYRHHTSYVGFGASVHGHTYTHTHTNTQTHKHTHRKVGGYIRIRSKTQGIALSLGDKITAKQRASKA